VSKKTQKN